MLSKTRPTDPGAGSVGTAKLVAQSDDFNRYQTEFVTAAETLMASGRCSAKGSDQIYLDVATGKIR